jgi:hypothetical protein
LQVCAAIDPVARLEEDEVAPATKDPKSSKDPKDPKSGIASAGKREPMFKLESISQMGSIDFARYASIVLYNPKTVSADAVDRLASWVDQGGGLMIILGSGFETAEAAMDSPLSKLLPGTVKRRTRRALSDRSVGIAPAINSHPIWSIFETPVEELPWVNFSIFRHWDIEELAPDASVLMRFTGSDQPALIEQSKKQGRILTMTVPYPEPVSHEGDQIWSNLYQSQDWTSYALFLGSIRYLAAWNKQQLNYWIDEPAVLDNNVSQFPQQYKLFNPTQEEVRVESAEETLVYPFTRYAGQYRMRGLRPQGPVVRGFSVNVHPDKVSLERIAPDRLDKALGKDQYRIAKERKDVQSSLGEGRYGRDLAPFLLMMFVLMIMAEQTMASHFYSTTKRGTA